MRREKIDNMKRALFSVLTCISSLLMYSQQMAFAKPHFFEHWFIQTQVGASCTLSEHFRDASISNLLAPHAAISIGKYFYPEVGARAQMEGGLSKNYDIKNKIGETFNVKYIQASFDGLWNLTNIFWRYKSPYLGENERKFNLIAITGIGLAYTFNNSKNKVLSTKSVVPRVGLQGDFQINDAISINLEIIANLYPDDFNGRVAGLKYDGIINTQIGITYRIKKYNNRMFRVIPLSQNEDLQGLNKRVNELRLDLLTKGG